MVFEFQMFPNPFWNSFVTSHPLTSIQSPLLHKLTTLECLKLFFNYEKNRRTVSKFPCLPASPFSSSVFCPFKLCSDSHSSCWITYICVWRFFMFLDNIYTYIHKVSHSHIAETSALQTQFTDNILSFMIILGLFLILIPFSRNTEWQFLFSNLANWECLLSILH